MTNTDLSFPDVIRISGKIQESIVDGYGIRYVLFLQGCVHNCTGCHNPETHSLSGGKTVKILDILSEIKNSPLISGVTFSGGEPFLQAKELLPLAKDILARGLSLWVYSGYTFEELISLEDKYKKQLLSCCDVLVDGKFILSERDLTLRFKGSRNQRIVNVKTSLSEKRILLLQ